MMLVDKNEYDPLKKFKRNLSSFLAYDAIFNLQPCFY